jgi:hypothetical protein
MFHRVAIGQPARGREGVGMRKAEHLALLRQAVDPELVARVRADDGQVQLIGQLGGAAGVVDVGVRQPDLLQRQPRRAISASSTSRSPPGSMTAAFRLIAPDDGAVLLEGVTGTVR